MSYVAGSELRPGATVSGYRIETLIGRGGMGAVYRAVDESLGRNVALKVIAAELAHDERFRKRFLRESGIAASLDHPHVIPIYQAGEEEGRLFLAMRYVEGTDRGRLVAGEADADRVTAEQDVLADCRSDMGVGAKGAWNPAACTHRRKGSPHGCGSPGIRALRALRLECGLHRSARE